MAYALLPAINYDVVKLIDDELWKLKKIENAQMAKWKREHQVDFIECMMEIISNLPEEFPYLHRQRRIILRAYSRIMHEEFSRIVAANNLLIEELSISLP